jgi:hypothetical protein
MPGSERSNEWLWRGVSWVLWSFALAAIVAYTDDEPFTAKLVLTFAGILALLYALLFVWGRVRDRFRRR